MSPFKHNDNDFYRFSYFLLLLIQFIALTSQSEVFAQNEDEIIDVDSSIVILNATITDKDGKPASGLDRSRFEVLENGVKQEVAFFETQESPFSAVILIDTSGSMEQRVSLARSAAITFLDKLRPDDNVAIYNFDSKVSMVQDFSNLRDLHHRAFNLEATGWTALNDAIFKAAEVLEKRKEKRRAIIVLSDGADTRSKHSSSRALKTALNANATIYTVDMSAINTGGPKRRQNQGALKNFAKKSGGVFVKTPGGRQMRTAFSNIVKELGVQYTLGYYPSNPKKDGKWRKIKLNVTGNGLTVRTREGYNAGKN
ncbi:MAG: VWA domain-containing protein [Pyrinomonadaceae bacterium]|nr:VWA domain-containing protein [Pyrinomonadaceae bacterium]